MILHCINIEAESIVVCSRDTDVLVLLIAHFSKMKCTQLWMKSGTSKKPRYIPVHEVHQRLAADIISALLPFHVITACDSVSQLLGHGKKTAWNVFRKCPELLQDLGKGELTLAISTSAETFICRLYGDYDHDTCNQTRVKMFSKCVSQESLPPTSDAVQLHIQRAHYQASVWTQADKCTPLLPEVSSSGWIVETNHLRPEMMRLPPIPDACLEILSCCCTKGCISRRCKCKKVGLNCTDACKCMDSDVPCRNIIE